MSQTYPPVPSFIVFQFRKPYPIPKALGWASIETQSSSQFAIAGPRPARLGILQSLNAFRRAKDPNILRASGDRHVLTNMPQRFNMSMQVEVGKVLDFLQIIEQRFIVVELGLSDQSINIIDLAANEVLN